MTDDTQNGASLSSDERQSKNVGYKQPPPSTRFKKGQSGNPKGRPKGSMNVLSFFTKTSREKVVINENGRRKTVTKLEAAFKQLLNKAASGDLRAISILTDLAWECEAKQGLPAAETNVLNAADEEVITGILGRFQPLDLEASKEQGDGNPQATEEAPDIEVRPKSSNKGGKL